MIPLRPKLGLDPLPGDPMLLLGLDGCSGEPTDAPLFEFLGDRTGLGGIVGGFLLG